MKNKNLQTLEFDKIIEMLISCAISPMGKALAGRLLPAKKLRIIEKAHEETQAALEMFMKKGNLPLGGIKNIENPVERATLGGILSIQECLQISDTFHAFRKVQKYAKSENKDDVCPVILEERFEIISVPSQLEKELIRTIKNEAELHDNASEQLQSIRNQMKSSSAKIKEQLNNIIQSTAYKNMLQDNVITIRSGRYCVPVKQEYKGSFDGIVHDQSSTGATVFMEPRAVITLNNKIKELAATEKEEIERILKQLSNGVAIERTPILDSLKMVTELDFIFAKANLSFSMNGIRPIFNENGYVNIAKGRHPLIDTQKIVPLDIYLGKDFTTLLITGPNTGGKTVALKTLGLFCLMAQAGLHIPASAGSELAIFDNVFSDIGDEQSIEQSLSTFSSHMVNIVSILAEITPKSLVLLDELGAGTDPTEGAALAISIIEYLQSKKVRAAITTHYSELKLYAISTEGIENASCEFDVATLAPTYRLLIGIPGKSNAFSISKKLGLSDEIIEHARNVLSKQDVKLEDIISDLEINKKTILYEKEQSEKYLKEIESLKKQISEQRTKLEQDKTKIIEHAKKEAQAILYEAKENADKIIKSMVKVQNDSKNINELDAMRKSLEKEITGLEPEKPKYAKPKKLSIGDTVFVHTMGVAGIVASEVKNNKVQVKMGIMKMEVPIDNLSLEKNSDIVVNNEKISVSTYTKSHKKSANISIELDIRGNLVEEGIGKLSKYLDDAYLSSLKQVTIIHGKGTGQLRRAVQEYLKKNSYVKNYRQGEFGEGDAGVTVVELN
ncbi:MAG: endonuclease MutS2 [Defluviitaleaceae bacterium]|nr:endonuclease MutS2 [Defluviitaleaceae bacterium]